MVVVCLVYHGHFIRRIDFHQSCVFTFSYNDKKQGNALHSFRFLDNAILLSSGN